MNDFKFIPNEEYFKKIRYETIGASDIPIILGLSKYKTPYELWREKTKRVEMWEGNEITEWGHRHEYNILYSYIRENTLSGTAEKFLIDYLQHLEKRTKRYKPPTNFYPFTEFFHPDIKWAISHPDCLEFQNEYLIQAKSHKKFVYDYDEIPISEYVQCQWEMLTSGTKENILRTLVNTNEEFTFNVKANKKIQEKLIIAAEKFWWHIQKDKEPMPINSNDIKKIFPVVKNESHYLVGSQSEMANKMKDRKEFLNSKIKKYSDEVKDINDAMFLMIGDNKYLYDEQGTKLCSQVQYSKISVNDLKKLEQNDNLLYTELKEKGYLNEKEIRFIR